MTKQSDLLTDDQAGEIFHLSGRRMRVLIYDGVIPAQRFGKRFIVRRSDLDKVPKDRKPGPESMKC